MRNKNKWKPPFSHSVCSQTQLLVHNGFSLSLLPLLSSSAAGWGPCHGMQSFWSCASVVFPWSSIQELLHHGFFPWSVVLKEQIQCVTHTGQNFQPGSLFLEVLFSMCSDFIQIILTSCFVLSSMGCMWKSALHGVPWATDSILGCRQTSVLCLEYLLPFFCTDLGFCRAVWLSFDSSHDCFMALFYPSLNMLSQMYKQYHSLAQLWPVMGPFWSWNLPVLGMRQPLLSSHRAYPCSPLLLPTSCHVNTI